jgi:hypothetical protein
MAPEVAAMATRKSRKPATEKSVTRDNTPNLRETLSDLTRRANAGSATALQDLRQFLDDHSEVWHHVGDAARICERMLVELVAESDNLLGESLVRQIESMKDELGGPQPTRMERMLVDQIVASWLGLQHAHMTATVNGSISRADYRQRRLSACQQRYFRASKALAQVRALLPKKLAPTISVRIFDAQGA